MHAICIAAVWILVRSLIASVFLVSTMNPLRSRNGIDRVELVVEISVLVPGVGVLSYTFKDSMVAFASRKC
jgi:hypothetical protein